MNQKITIKITNVSKHFYDLKKGRVDALNNVSFECRPGDITGILGPNGAGKTTLLRIISSLISPSGGNTEFSGLESGTDIKTQIGFLSGDTKLYERLTSLEMIRFCGMLQGIDETTLQKRIDQLAELLNMQPIMKRLCRNLSTGEQQKVAITRAIINDPKILILDEPTNGLDLITGKDILWLVKEMKSQGKTILYSAHNMEEIEKLCDRIVMIYKGKLIEYGTIDEVVKRNNATDLSDCFLKLVKDNEL